MSAIVELTIFPMDKGEGVSPYVARVLKIIRASGLRHELNPMGTCIEGDWDELMAVVDRCFKDLSVDCGRVYMTMNVDWRRGRVDGLAAKTASVRGKLD